MSDEAEKRYQEIMRRIEAQRQARQHETQAASLGQILNSLNVQQQLDDLRDRLRRLKQRPLHVHGPKAKTGRHGLRVVVWLLTTGVPQDLTLTLLGVWATPGSQVTITVGTRQLPYNAPIFTAEAYWQLIKRDYSVYYADDGSPPTDDRVLLRTVYDPAQRLTLRAQIADALSGWRGDA